MDQIKMLEILKHYLDVRTVDRYNPATGRYEDEERLIVRPIHIDKKDLDKIKEWMQDNGTKKN